MRVATLDRIVMSPYRFRCPDCAQRIELEEPGREAAVESGCPFCGSAVGAKDFAATTS
ncbi:hypothetical protein Halxa_3918 [Halopiger xanaduensis SH-6]|uniref:Uncharacterized protein n=1 Tax=Halopiger xanaduensis (strain DSM 18323 / JCM 14033 / SH-6) TaxID=797210 RepID=F8D391_HALXS|nr:hypothetical protein Halxa_3918 [Halopiger xanaduensis SH-6]